MAKKMNLEEIAGHIRKLRELKAVERDIGNWFVLYNELTHYKSRFNRAYKEHYKQMRQKDGS